MALMKKAAGVLSWLSRPVIWFIGNRAVAMGQHSFMHGGRQAGGNPGPEFPSRSNVGPFTEPNGGHVCAYAMNSSGGTTAATTLPAGNNRLARQEANQRALTPVARGLHSRAACHESAIRGGTSAKPPAQMPNVSVNYQVRVTGSSVNIRTGPGTNFATVKGSPVLRGTTFDIDREQRGLDSQVNDSNALWRRIRGGQFDSMWVVGRFTEETATPPATPQPTVGTWSVQCVAARGDTASAYIDGQIARLRGMGFADAFRTNINGWYQARVPAGTREQAIALAAVMEDKGFTGAYPVQNT